jgi:phenylacetic acid degradation operon negative regulatory protein
MKTSSIHQWISHFLQQDPPRAKSVVMTVFGDAITPRGGTVWLGSLIALLAPLGISDRLVRTSVYRLAEEGWLEASRSGRRSQYRLTAQGEKRFTRAHQRIYAPAQAAWDGRWTLVMTAPEIISAATRLALKKELLWEGFGLIAPGMYAHPGGKDEALSELLARTGTDGKVFVVSAAEMDAVSSRPLSDLLTHCWELDKVVADYSQFIASFAPLLALLKQQRALDAQQAFTIRTLLIHAFRRVQLHDPQLPAELLRTDWPGAAAYELCRSLYQLTSGQADVQVATTLATEQEDVPPLAAHYVQRFGGLAA